MEAVDWTNDPRPDGYDPAEEIPGGRRHRLHFPAKPGKHSFDRLSDEDRANIAKLAKGRKSVIEIGTFIGGSAEIILENMDPEGRLVCVDTFRGTPANETKAIPREIMLCYALQRLEPHEHRLTVIVGKSLDAAACFKDGIADMIFLDADHRYSAVTADIGAWFPKLMPGGVFCGHDFYKWAINRELPPGELELDRQSEPETVIHWGVTMGVYEAFEKSTLHGGTSCSIWSAEQAWRRKP